ncbi:MAG TPA: bacillithiol system redox-active protein YtxJ [Bacteroidetes bacterium]|nr:bacillithiol system redox-active protein YtxJ [Bacteroidota bacterium]
MNWIPLTRAEQLNQIAERSHQVPCLLFKHSTSCSISSIAKFRLESDWPFTENEMPAYYLDLLAFRNISNAIAEQFQVHHESPQVILVWKGEVVLDASHLDISVEEIKEVMSNATA